MSDTIKKSITKVLRIFKFILLTTLGVVLLLSVLLLLPSVQNGLADMAVKKLEEKLHTTVSLGQVRIIIPNSVTVKDLYLEDQRGDTLLDAGMIKVHVGLFGLLKKRIDIRLIDLQNITGKLSRPEGDSAFNYSFIPEAFSSGNTSRPDTSGPGTSFRVGRVKLSHIRFQYNDHLTGNKVQAMIGEFSVRFRKFSLKPTIIGVGRMQLNNSNARLVLSGGSSSESSGGMPEISLHNDLELHNVGFHMEDQSSGQRIDLRHVDLQVDPDQVELKDHILRLKRVKLQDAVAEIHTGTPTRSQGGSLSHQSGSGIGWDIRSENLVLRNNDIAYEVDTAVRHPGEVDFNHLDVKRVSGAAEKIRINDQGYQAIVNQLSFLEKSGFSLSGLQAKATVTERMIDLRELKIKTPYSEIANRTTLHFSSFKGIVRNPENTRFTVVFDQSRISLKDLAYFSSGMAGKIPAGVRRAGTVGLAADIQGRIASFDVHELRMSAGDSLTLALSGRISGMPHFRKANFNIRLDTLHARRQDILALLPDSLLPSSIDLPQRISMQGSFEGTMHDFHTGFGFVSSQGNIAANIRYREDPDSAREYYSGRIDAKDYDLGRLLMNPDTLGKISVNGEFKGSSNNFKDPEATFDFSIPKFTVLGYTYQHIGLSGKFSNHVFNGNASISDTNVVASFQGKASLKDSVPSYDFTFRLEGLDARAVNLTSGDIRLKGTLRADFTGGSIDSLNGYLKAYDMVVVRNGNFYPLDSVIVKAANNPGGTELDVKSQFVDANYSGTVRFSKLPGMLKNYVNYYFDLQQDTMNREAHPGNFELRAQFFNTDLLSEVFLPNLHNFMQSEVTASYDGSKPVLSLSANFPQVDYKNVIVDTFRAEVTSDKQQFSIKAGVEHVSARPFEVPGILLSGNISRDTVHWIFRVRGTKKTDLYHIAGFMQSRQQGIYIGLDSSDLVLNRKSFNIPPDNYLRISGSQIEAKDLRFRNGNQLLSFSSGSDTATGSAALRLGFKNFDINNLLAMVSGDRTIIRATTDGNVALTAAGGFHSDLALSEISLFGENVFDRLRLKASAEKAALFSCRLI